MKLFIAAVACASALTFPASAAAGPSDHIYTDPVLCALNPAFQRMHQKACVGFTNVETCCSNGGGQAPAPVTPPDPGTGGGAERTRLVGSSI